MIRPNKLDRNTSLRYHSCLSWEVDAIHNTTLYKSAVAIPGNGAYITGLDGTTPIYTATPMSICIGTDVAGVSFLVTGDNQFGDRISETISSSVAGKPGIYSYRRIISILQTSASGGATTVSVGHSTNTAGWTIPMFARTAFTKPLATTNPSLIVAVKLVYASAATTEPTITQWGVLGADRYAIAMNVVAGTAAYSRWRVYLDPQYADYL